MDAGLGFGLSSGVITTVGLAVGLAAGTQSREAVLGGILVIAVADSLSDALGIHIAEEGRGVAHRLVWRATWRTFLSKLLVALSFLPPVLLLPLPAAVAACLLWAALVLGLVSVPLARSRGLPAWLVAAEHLGIGAAVVAASHLAGRGVALLFPP